MKKIVFSLLVLLLLPSCTFTKFQEPTPTSTNTLTPSPTLAPTQTPQPTATRAPTKASLPPVTRLTVLDGFTISIPIPLQSQVNGNAVLIADQEQTLSISFAGDSHNDTQSLMKVIDSYLASLEKRGWKFTKGESMDVQIGTITGLALNLTGNAGDITFEGEAVAASPRTGYVLFGLGISKVNLDKDSWKNKGQAIFDSLVKTIQFTDTNTACPVSTDKTYGYKEDNPIEVGGSDFGGPSRERAYLDHLQGPNREQLTYERTGSMPSGETILDIFHITGSGLDVTLYVDEYNYSEPQAPVGFSCEGAFPLSKP
ncbi:MAG TPA: hypothetical protein VN653_11805 [Anaerolineales bacterium]|nr:hypothetical protein [Anaerolineales bacterium]